MSTLHDPSVPGETSLDSFVLRFVRRPEEPSHPAIVWHGIIRHVQSNSERAFSRWGDAVSFISEFVDLAEEGVDA